MREGKRKERDELIRRSTDFPHLELEHALCPGHFPLPTPTQRRVSDSLVSNVLASSVYVFLSVYVLTA